MPVPAKKAKTPSAATIENVLVKGDLAKLTDEQRVEYYLSVCRSLGLNPQTRPFEYLVLSGRLTLYARRDAADQLRKINGISVEILGREHVDGLLLVHVRAHDKSGRSDEDYGAVPFKPGASEFAANALLKCVTKAKRRVTLSISGLGFLDETEIPKDASKPGEKISQEQVTTLIELADRVAADKRAFVAYLSQRWEIEVASLADIPADLYHDALAQLERKAEKIDKADAEAST